MNESEIYIGGGLPSPESMGGRGYFVQPCLTELPLAVLIVPVLLRAGEGGVRHLNSAFLLP